MNFEEYLKQRFIYIFLPVLLIVAIVYVCVTQIPPCMESYNASVQAENDLNSKKMEVESERAKSRNVEKQDDLKKEIYTITDGSDAVSASGLILEEILNFAKETGLRLLSIEYAGDSSSVNSKTDKVTVNTNFISNYNSFNNFLNKLVNYNFLIGLNKIDIKPYEKDKTKIISNFSFDIYIAK